MSEENAKVSMEEHNKVVGAHNDVKTENTKLAEELKELKAKQAEITKNEEVEKIANDKITEEKKAWEKEMEDRDKQIADLKAKAETPDDKTVSKGLVKDPASGEEKRLTIEEETNKLNEQIGTIPEKDPTKFANRWARYGHFKNPATKHFTEQEFGKALSLHAGAIEANHIQLSDTQKSYGSGKSANDVVIPRTYGTDNKQ